MKSVSKGFSQINQITMSPFKRKSSNTGGIDLSEDASYDKSKSIQVERLITQILDKKLQTFMETQNTQMQAITK